MNCKPGDLAMLVFSRVGNEGKIFTVIRLATAGEVSDWRLNPRLTWWAISEPIRSSWGDYFEYAPDEFLRPIRDQDGTDEMIRIAGLPQEQGVKA